MLIHSVYFWLNPSADPAIVGRFRAGLERLASIPDVKSAHVGPPAATPKRSVVDDSYSWALVALFDDVAAHDRYQDHPIHHDFLSEFGESWQRVQVYNASV